MKKLRVLVSFRDENNFFLLHKTGDVIFVEENRASRLVKGGLCEVIEEPKVHRAPASVPAEEKKEELPVEESHEEEPPVEEATKEQPSEEPAEAQPVKRQYRRRKTE